MICKNCQKSIPNTANTCPYCGKKTKRNDTSDTFSVIRIIGIIGGVLLIICAMLPRMTISVSGYAIPLEKDATDIYILTGTGLTAIFSLISKRFCNIHIISTVALMTGFARELRDMQNAIQFIQALQKLGVLSFLDKIGLHGDVFPMLLMVTFSVIELPSMELRLHAK